MFSQHKFSGKHLIADIKEIQNITLLNNIKDFKYFLDLICEKYNYKILSKCEHKFEPNGFTIVYLLSESHLSIHTFPECNYFAFDLYTCCETENAIYDEIYFSFIEKFNAKGEYKIIDRNII
jgi:S-adenosylmethionine decarboxylase